MLISLVSMLMTLDSYVAYISPSPTTSVQITTIAFAASVTLLGGLALVPGATKRLASDWADVSYALYLVHCPIVYAVSRSSIEGPAVFMVVLTVNVVLSVFLILTVETSILRWRDTRRRAHLYL